MQEPAAAEKGTSRRKAESDRPIVTVIVPVYNRAAQVTDAIESVLGQTFTDFELIIVDDASSDGTVEVVEAIADPRLRVFRNVTNMGPAGARNAGVTAARGRLLAFLDSDDRWRPEKLERQIAYMRERNVAVCCTGFDLHRPQRQAAELRLPNPPRLAGGDMIDRADICVFTTIMIDRELFDAVGPLDQDMRRLEDWDWLLRLSRHATLDFVTEALADHWAPDHRDIAQETRDAAQLIVEKQAAGLVARDGIAARRLRAMAFRHIASANWLSGRPYSAIVPALRAFCLAPGPNLRFALRRLSGGGNLRLGRGSTTAAGGGSR